MARAVDGDVVKRRVKEIAEAWKACGRDYEAMLLWSVVEQIVDSQPTLTPQWISVEERLPEKNGTYLVYAPTYSGGSSSALDCVGGVMFSRFKNKKWSIEAGYYKRPNCVTHWMPMPEPPNGKEAPHE